jgi:hypothetical protein
MVKLFCNLTVIPVETGMTLNYLFLFSILFLMALISSLKNIGLVFVPAIAGQHIDRKIVYDVLQNNVNDIEKLKKMFAQFL